MIVKIRDLFFDRLTTNDHKLYKLDKLQEVGWECSLCDSKKLPVLKSCIYI